MSEYIVKRLIERRKEYLDEIDDILLKYNIT